MIVKEKKIPSVYMVKQENKHGNFDGWLKRQSSNDIAGCALDENILRNVLGQVAIEEHVFDHDDINPEAASRVMKELITYDESNIDKLEEKTHIEEKDFLKFMQFR